MLILDVPYDEKDDVKCLGARWNPAVKKWYVENKEDYYKFVRWIAPYGNMVVIDELYLVEGIQKCFGCNNDTRVIGFGITKHLSIDTLLYFERKNKKGIFNELLLEINQEAIQIVGPIDPIPEPLMDYIQSKYNYKARYSKTTHESSVSNCCDNCDVLQGDFYLFNDVDSPFFIDSKEDVKNLKIYKIKLEQDLIIKADEGWGEFDNMLKEYGKIIPLNLENYDCGKSK